MLRRTGILPVVEERSEEGPRWDRSEQSPTLQDNFALYARKTHGNNHYNFGFLFVLHELPPLFYLNQTIHAGNIIALDA